MTCIKYLVVLQPKKNRKCAVINLKKKKDGETRKRSSISNCELGAVAPNVARRQLGGMLFLESTNRGKVV